MVFNGKKYSLKYLKTLHFLIVYFIDILNITNMHINVLIYSVYKVIK